MGGLISFCFDLDGHWATDYEAKLVLYNGDMKRPLRQNNIPLPKHTSNTISTTFLQGPAKEVITLDNAFFFSKIMADRSLYVYIPFAFVHFQRSLQAIRCRVPTAVHASTSRPVVSRKTGPTAAVRLPKRSAAKTTRLAARKEPFVSRKSRPALASARCRLC